MNPSASPTPPDTSSSFLRRWRPSSWHLHVHFSTAAFAVGAWLCMGVLTAMFLLYAGKELAPIPKTGSYVAVDVQRSQRDPAGIAPFIPGSGMQFVVVDVLVENRTNESLYLAPVVQTYLTDASNNRYFMSPLASPSPLLAGVVVGGEVRTGTLTYLVPLNAGQLTFHFKTDTPKDVSVERAL